ncbi:MAG: oligoribonuclease [Actinomycetaceae bacterium]|nr:oligoribonuclease [Actinomycetaceae bacterium]
MSTVETIETTPLVWIDCEMTGLDLKQDTLIEVAVVCTDAHLNLLDAGIDVIIRPPDAALEQMSTFVRSMHTHSGLLTDLPNGTTLADAQQRVLDYIKRFAPVARKALLAGNSIGTDKAFLAKEMPDVIEHLHYRVIDVSSVKELARHWYPRTFFNAPQKQGGHRALADITESIQELRYYRQLLWPADEGPSSEKCAEVAQQVTQTMAAETATLRARDSQPQ